jgi:ATP-dependent exoDNAse (exonuclease V) beta subunit
VYHNSGCSGAVDIVGIKNGEVYLFDVKMNKNPKKSTAKSRTALQKKLGVQFLLFDPRTRKLRLQKHKE